MDAILILYKLLLLSLLSTAGVSAEINQDLYQNVEHEGNEEITNEQDEIAGSIQDEEEIDRRLRDVGKLDGHKGTGDKNVTPKNLDKVTFEVQRLFDSFNDKRDKNSETLRGDENANEITVVIENDGENEPPEGNVREERDNVQQPVDQSGFTIVLDHTDPDKGVRLSGGNSEDFTKLSHSLELMNRRFEGYLKEEKSHIPTHKINTQAIFRPASKAKQFMRSSPTKQVKRRMDIARNKLEPTIRMLKSIRNKLKMQQEALRVEDDNDGGNHGRSIISSRQKEDQASLQNKKDESRLPFSNPSPRSVLQKVEAQKSGSRPVENLKLINRTNEKSFYRNNEKEDLVRKENKSKKEKPSNLNEKTGRRENENKTEQRNNSKEGEKEMKNDTERREKEKDRKHDYDIYKNANSSHGQDESSTKNKHFTEQSRQPTAQQKPKVNEAENDNQKEFITKQDDKNNIDNIAGNNEPPTSNKTGEKIVHPRKAQAMLEYLNKDPLEMWIFKFVSLKELGLNSTMLRNGLVNAGSIDLLKNVMSLALKGEDITLSIIGGSISAGGGLYKDEESIDGLYYKGLVDWWNKAITPLTGSQMKVNNIAIGSIGTDYFSFCLKSHILNESNIILWELSGNDYNRYLKQPTKGARPLERLTRMALLLPRSPALLYINFFKGVDYKSSKKTCPNFEDQGEDIVAHYYKIPSLSWRAMVCEPLIEHKELFTLATLFCKDQYHPSLRAHAQTALLLILHLRHVMRSVLQEASSHDGFLPDFTQLYTLPPPLFLGLEYPTPLCWTLITPDFKESIYDSLDVKILTQTGFKLEYATNFPIRFDRVICWKAENVGSVMKIQFSVPDNLNTRKKQETKPSKKAEVAITTHTRFGGSAEVWIDQRPDNPVIIKEGREHDTGKRTQVDMITKNLDPGVHTLNLKAVAQGFCLTSIMVD